MRRLNPAGSPIQPGIDHTASNPVVIGGTGGSGTRAVQSALAAAGVFMGERLNESGDAMDFEPFLDPSSTRSSWKPGPSPTLQRICRRR